MIRCAYVPFAFLLFLLVPSLTYGQTSSPAPVPSAPPSEQAPATTASASAPAGTPVAPVTATATPTPMSTPPSPVPTSTPAQPWAVYQPRPLAAYRRGLTFEASAGLGGRFSHNNDTGDNSDTQGVAALSLGLGWFVNPSIGVGLRFITSIDTEEFKDANGNTSTTVELDSFFGPSLQYWFPNQGWIGGGVGWGRLGATITFPAMSPGAQPDTGTFRADGMAVNARAGYTWTTNSEHIWNISAEFWFGFYRDDITLAINGSPFLVEPININTYNVAVLFGYQHL